MWQGLLGQCASAHCPWHAFGFLLQGSRLDFLSPKGVPARGVLQLLVKLCLLKGVFWGDPILGNKTVLLERLLHGGQQNGSHCSLNKFVEYKELETLIHSFGFHSFFHVQKTIFDDPTGNPTGILRASCLTTSHRCAFQSLLSDPKQGIAHWN